MGKMGTFSDGDGGGRSAYRKRRPSPCMRQNQRKEKLHQSIWVPAVPSWEKEFCYEIGRFKWANFVQAKKLTGFTPKIFEWNDSGAEEAFYSAKAAYFARIHGLPPENPQLQSDFEPSPDLYIDEINWDDENEDEDEDLNVDGLKELGNVSSDGGEDENGKAWWCIRIEDIRPTGWDDDLEEISRGGVLTGLIVGE